MTHKQKFKRMDKKQKKFILSNIEGLKKDIQNKIYTDFHFIRPYSKFHKCIKNISTIIV